MEVVIVKLLRVKASHFKNMEDDTVIDFVAKSKKTTEDKEYELLKVADDLYVYSIGAFVGKNASGKTSALDLLDCCYDILSEFRLENKHYDYEGVSLEIIFFHEEYIYKYNTELRSDPTLGNRASFIISTSAERSTIRPRSTLCMRMTAFKRWPISENCRKTLPVRFLFLKRSRSQHCFMTAKGKALTPIKWYSVY